MAAVHVDPDLKNLTSCPVCSEGFHNKNPRLLSCLHALCEDCIQNNIDCKKVNNTNDDGKIYCPVCSCPTVIPGSKAASLPLYILNLEIEDSRKQFCDRHVICPICQTETHTAVMSSYCFSCCSGLCSGCRIDHDDANLDHKLIQISPSAIQHIMCRKHDFHLEYFCITCCRAICSKCRTEGHTEHKLNSLTYESQDTADDFEEFLESKLQAADQALSRLDKLQNDVDRNVNALYEDLKRHRDNLIKDINDKYVSLCGELKVTQCDIQEEIDKTKKFIKDARSSIAKFIRETQCWRKPIKEVPEARVTNLDQLTAEVKQQIPVTDVEVDIPLELHFIPATDDIHLGEIVKDLTSSSSGREPTLTWQIRTWESVRGIEHIADNKIIVVTWRVVIVYNEKGREIPHYLSRARQDISSNGWMDGVGVNRNRCKIVITEDRGQDVEGRLHVYSKQSGVWSYNTYVVCKRPVWVGFTNSDEYIVSSYTDNKIYRYSQHAMQVMCMDTSSYLRSLCIDNKNRIVVCLEKKVCIYDENGTEVLSSQTLGTDLNLFDVCVSSTDSILVCDRTSRSVLSFDKNGVFTRRLVTLEELPWRISLYKDTYLAVCDCHNNLSVYKL